jgi:hypothetical protein
LIQRAIVLTLIVGGLWLGWRWYFPNDEAQIGAVLRRIAAAVGSAEETGGAANSGGVQALARAASLRSELAVNVTVDAGPPFQRLTGRDAVIGAAARVNGTARNLELRFPDVAITVSADRTSATAMVTAEARFDEPGGGRALDARELEIGFTRPEGNWVVTTVTVMQPLERLP